MKIEELKFDEKGLIPAVIQDYKTREVLTVAYMNKESLDITIREQRTCFWSRSRQELWRKGETSGNVQHVVSISADCDGDSLLVKVIPTGPACHTGAVSCFYEEIYNELEKNSINIEELYQLIKDRKDNMQEGSYTSYLFEKGREKILKKIGEESTEVVIGAMKDDRQETIFEISDLCYHTLVLMVEMNISTADILEELASRHVVDKKVKQETMK